jgi:hypothetical protein
MKAQASPLRAICCGPMSLRPARPTDQPTDRPTAERDRQSCGGGARSADLAAGPSRRTCRPSRTRTGVLYRVTDGVHLRWGVKVTEAGYDEGTRLGFSRILIARCADLVRFSASVWVLCLGQSIRPGVTRHGPRSFGYGAFGRWRRYGGIRRRVGLGPAGDSRRTFRSAP